MGIQERIQEAFAPQACGSDPPHAAQRVHMFQVPSDRLRDKAREFVTLAVALVPAPNFHEELVEAMNDFVRGAEYELARYLEETPAFKGDGFKRREDGTFGYATQATSESVGRSDDDDEDGGDTDPPVADVRRR